MNEGSSIKAYLVNGMSSDLGKLLYVVASDTAKMPSDISLRAFYCPCCQVRFASVDDSTPHCPVCDCAQTKPKMSQPNIERIVGKSYAVRCTRCRSFNLLSANGARIFDNHINCLHCGTDLRYNYSAP